MIENTHEEQDAKGILKYQHLGPKLPVFLPLLYLAQCVVATSLAPHKMLAWGWRCAKVAQFPVKRMIRAHYPSSSCCFAFCGLVRWYLCVLPLWHTHPLLSSQAGGWRALPKQTILKPGDSGRSGRGFSSPGYWGRIPAVVREEQVWKLKSPGGRPVQPWGWGSDTSTLCMGEEYLCVYMGDGINQCIKAEGTWWSMPLFG